MSVNSSHEEGGVSGVWLRVRILNSLVFSLRTTVRGTRDSLREADHSFSARRRIIGSVSASSTSSGNVSSTDMDFVEDTFPEDVLLAETEPMIRRLAEKLWSASRKESRVPRTVVLKLKTREFKILTRSYTGNATPSSCAELTEIALKLRERVTLGPQQRYRLVGVGLSNFQEAEPIGPQPALFE